MPAAAVAGLPGRQVEESMSTSGSHRRPCTPTAGRLHADPLQAGQACTRRPRPLREVIRTLWSAVEVPHRAPCSAACDWPWITPPARSPAAPMLLRLGRALLA